MKKLFNSYFFHDVLKFSIFYLFFTYHFWSDVLINPVFWIPVNLLIALNALIFIKICTRLTFHFLALRKKRQAEKIQKEVQRVFG